MTGRKLLDYMDNESAEGRKDPPDPKSDDNWFVYFGSTRAVYKAALKGILVVKGRLKGGSELQDIPRDYWETATIDLISNYDGSGEAFTVPRDRNTPTYELLRFPRDQVVEIWPPAVKTPQAPLSADVTDNAGAPRERNRKMEEDARRANCIKAVIAKRNQKWPKPDQRPPVDRMAEILTEHRKPEDFAFETVRKILRGSYGPMKRLKIDPS